MNYVSSEPVSVKMDDVTGVKPKHLDTLASVLGPSRWSEHSDGPLSSDHNGPTLPPLSIKYHRTAGPAVGGLLVLGTECLQD